VFCRLDELIAAAKQYSSACERAESKLRLPVIILALVIAVLAVSLILLFFKYRKSALGLGLIPVVKLLKIRKLTLQSKMVGKHE